MRDVWMSNFEAELQELWRIAGTFNHVAIDMEYPGIVLEVDDDTTLGQSGVTGVSSSRRSRNYLQVRVGCLFLSFALLWLLLSFAGSSRAPWCLLGIP